MLSPIRASLAQLMDATVRNEPRWHYKEVRPLPFPSANTAEHGTVYSDCSFGCIILCKLAGAPDPSGYGFSGYGNSTSFFNHLQHVPLELAKVGDIIVYGPQGNQHAVMVREPGRDPLVWSHGQERGPLYVRHSIEAAGHKAPATACRLNFPAPPLPPKPRAWKIIWRLVKNRWLPSVEPPK